MTITLMDALNDARRLRMDLTNAQAKLTDIIEALAAHPDAELPRPKCPVCGTTFRGERSLSEHAYHAHDGPVPQHYLEAEARADLPYALEGATE